MPLVAHQQWGIAVGAEREQRVLCPERSEGHKTCCSRSAPTAMTLLYGQPGGSMAEATFEVISEAISEAKKVTKGLFLFYVVYAVKSQGPYSNVPILCC